MANSPDIVFVGHVVRDLLPGGRWRPGGSVVYGAHLAARWGFRPAVLTAAAKNDEALNGFPAGAALEVLASEATTTFCNLPGTPRVQEVSAVASPLPPEALPSSWRAPAAIFVAPVIGEAPASFLQRAQHRGIRGVGLQGWLRHLDAASKVQAVDLRNVDLGAIVGDADAVFVSDEDLAATPSAEALLAGMAHRRTNVLLTLAERGARLLTKDGSYAIPACRATATDTTGAGDVFATAYLLGLLLGEAPLEAARLAAAAAACSVEGEGIAAIPSLDEARRRLIEAAKP